jgi:hypothetical protein
MGSSNQPPTNVEREHTFDVRSVNRIVCIMGYTSSASCLMSSLMDGHPNVLTTPDNLLSSFQDFWQEHGKLPLGELLSAFLDYYPVIFDARSTPECHKAMAERGEARGFTSLGPHRNEWLEVDRADFQVYMTELIGDTHPVPRKLFFQALHVAYGRASRREVRNPIIVFGLHNLRQPQRLQGLIEDFSDVCFLHMVRHPLRATASRFRRQLHNGMSPSHFHRIITGIARGGVTDPSTPAARWRAVRMEDLHHAPEQTVRKVCDWLDLSWNDVLLDSTINGKQWWNEKGSLQVSGFNTAIASQSFEEYLPGFDRLRLNILLGRKCAAWGYSVPWWSKNLVAKVLVLPLLVVPFKMELMALSAMMASIRQAKEPPMRRAWLRSRALIGGFGLGRIALLRAWFLTLGGRHREVQLL